MSERGGSLVELCVVLGLIGTLCAMALPGWGALAARHHGRAVVREMASELRMARQLAMARHERVRVVINADQSSLRTECIDCGGLVLRWYYFAQRGTTIQSMTNRGEIIFQPSGRSATATTIVLAGPRQESPTVTVSLTGRVTTS